MAKITKEVIDLIIADHRTGNFTQRDLARKYRLSLGAISKITKGISQDFRKIVNAGVAYRTALAGENEQSVNAIEQVVNEKTNYLKFFENATLKNCAIMIKKVGEKTNFIEHKIVQETLNKGKETVLGKEPDTKLELTQNNLTQTNVVEAEGDYLKRIQEGLIG